MVPPLRRARGWQVERRGGERATPAAAPAAAGSTPGARAGVTTHLTAKRRAGRSPPPPEGSPRRTVPPPASLCARLRPRADSYMANGIAPLGHTEETRQPGARGGARCTGSERGGRGSPRPWGRAGPGRSGRVRAGERRSRLSVELLARLQRCPRAIARSLLPASLSLWSGDNKKEGRWWWRGGRFPKKKLLAKRR